MYLNNIQAVPQLSPKFMGSHNRCNSVAESAIHAPKDSVHIDKSKNITEEVAPEVKKLVLATFQDISQKNISLSDSSKLRQIIANSVNDHLSAKEQIDSERVSNILIEAAEEKRAEAEHLQLISGITTQSRISSLLFKVPTLSLPSRKRKQEGEVPLTAESLSEYDYTKLLPSPELKRVRSNSSIASDASNNSAISYRSVASVNSEVFNQEANQIPKSEQSEWKHRSEAAEAALHADRESGGKRYRSALSHAWHTPAHRVGTQDPTPEHVKKAIELDETCYYHEFDLSKHALARVMQDNTAEESKVAIEGMMASDTTQEQNKIRYDLRSQGNDSRAPLISSWRVWIDRFMTDRLELAINRSQIQTIFPKKSRKSRQINQKSPLNDSNRDSKVKVTIGSNIPGIEEQYGINPQTATRFDIESTFSGLFF